LQTLTSLSRYGASSSRGSSAVAARSPVRQEDVFDFLRVAWPALSPSGQMAVLSMVKALLAASRHGENQIP
jgi:hypothetical protein